MNRKVLLMVMLTLLAVSIAGCGITDSLNSTAGGIKDRFEGLKFIVVNFIAIAAVMFLLQAFLVPTTEQNKVQRTALQLAVLAIAGIFAFQLKNDFIWRHPVIAQFIHLKVLVNIAVVTVGILVLKELLPFIRNQFKENKAGNTIVILGAIMIAIMVALSPFKIDGQTYTWQELGDGSDYPFVWQMPSGVKMKYFLLGDPACDEPKGQHWWDGGGKYCYTDSAIISEIRQKNPRYMQSIDLKPGDVKYRWGILRMPYLGIAIGLSLILFWTFAFLKFGPDDKGGKFAQWALAIYLAISMANEGMGVRPAVQLGEMLLFFLFWQGTKTAGSMKSGTAALLSGYVVNYVAVKTFPEHQILGWLGRQLVSPTILKAVLPIIIVVFIMFRLFGRGALKGLVGKDIMRRAKQRAIKIKNNLAKQDNWLGRLLRRVKDFPTGGSEPRAMIEHRYKFFVMTNYLERVQTLLEKGAGAVELSEVTLPKVEGVVKQYNTRDFALELYRWRRSGGLMRFDDKTGKVEFEKLQFKHDEELIRRQYCSYVLEAMPDGNLITKAPSNRDNRGNWNSIFDTTKIYDVIKTSLWVVGDTTGKIPVNIQTAITQVYTQGAALAKNIALMKPPEYSLTGVGEPEIIGQVSSANDVVRIWNRILTKVFVVHWMLNIPEGSRRHHPGLIALPGSWYREWEIYEEEKKIEDPHSPGKKKTIRVKKERPVDPNGWKQIDPHGPWLEVDVRGYEMYNPSTKSINKELMRTGWYSDSYPTASNTRRVQQWADLGNMPSSTSSIVKRFPYHDQTGRRQIILMPTAYNWAVMNKIEWQEYFSKDLRFGNHHPNSLSFKDYATYFEEHHRKELELGSPDLNEDTLPRFPPAKENPAYDERAFKRPGYFIPQGRFEPLNQQMDESNPDPAITSHGLSMWIQWMLRVRCQPAEFDPAARMWIFANPYGEDRDKYVSMVRGMIKEVKKE